MSTGAKIFLPFLFSVQAILTLHVMNECVNEATLQEILLSSLDNVNYYVSHIKENMRAWTRTIELADLKF